MQLPFQLSSDVEPLLLAEDANAGIWIVGGAIRDHLIGRKTSDVDFVTDGDAVALARKVADHIQADVYILDQDRGAARVLLTPEEGVRSTLDFAQVRGGSIEADLRGRDFTINALALRTSALEDLIDPCGGLQHLRDGMLEMCSADAIDSDPIRALRAIRIATDLNFRLAPNLVNALRSPFTFEPISRERMRDELFKILALGNPSTALRLLLKLDLLQRMFKFSYSHHFEINELFSDRSSLDKALRSVDHLRRIFDVLSSNADLDDAAEAAYGLLTWSLGRFRRGLESYLEVEIGFERTRAAMTLFSAFLYQALPTVDQEAQSKDPSDVGDVKTAEVIRWIADDLRLSREESSFMTRFVVGVEQLLSQEGPDTPADLRCHRYFRQTTDSGVAAGLTVLAYQLSESVEPPAMDRWSSLIENVRQLLEAWFEKPDQIIQPEPLIDGEDVVRRLGIEPGPLVGELLHRVIEAQVIGDLGTRGQALDFIESEVAKIESRRHA